MHSVTSNAVNEAVALTSGFLIPISTTFQTNSTTSWVQYKTIGGFTSSYYNSLPRINGKVRKVRLIYDIYTASSNGITVGIKKQNDANYTILDNNAVVWGGIGVNAYSSLRYYDIDAGFLNNYSQIAFKSSNSNAVAIGFMFAQVYYA